MRRVVLFLVLLCASAAAAGVEAPADIEKWAVAKSERFIVLTEKPAHKPAELLKLLDDFWSSLAAEFRVEIEPAGSAPTPVYIFGGRANFEDYLTARHQPMTLAGWCHVDADGAFIATCYRDFGPHDSVWVTLRHEATHLFLFMHVPDAKNLPGWINEGLAVYYASANVKDRKFTGVDVPARELHRVQAALRIGGLETLHRHLTRRDGDWSGPAAAQAWSLVHYLLHGEDGKNRKAFRRYLFSVGAARSGAVHFRKVFNVKLRRFRQRWKEYILKISPTPRRSKQKQK